MAQSAAKATEKPDASLSLYAYDAMIIFGSSPENTVPPVAMHRIAPIFGSISATEN
jgi:hypothetical protein